ncbi:MAG: thioredoxin-disulfide reductase [Clostridia bacterium]|nr:thioredoxin-disulfide reductase [Clostridia bacterium]
MYDTIIVGGGPCGLTAAIYLARANKKVLVLEKFAVGGQMAQTFNIENYPGEMKIDGFVLAENMQKQCKALGVQFKYEEVVSCELNADLKKVSTHKNLYEAKTVLICTGAYAKQLGAKNEKQFVGKGVSYCATCDGNFFKNKEVAVVGGGNTALEDCLYLADIAKKVYLIHRRDEFRGDAISVEKVKKLQEQGKVEFVTSSVLEEVSGQDNVEKIMVKNLKSDAVNDLEVQGVFIAVGRKPDTGFVSQLELDEFGYIKTNQDMQTNLKGVFAGGDVRNTNFRQIVTACSDGAVASVSIIKYLAEQ